MKLRRATMIALGAALASGACASGGAPAGPVTSPTGEVYPAGVPPRETKRTNEIEVLLLKAGGLGGAASPETYQQALDQSLAVIREDTANPLGYYLAGQAQVGLGNFAAADTLWARAQQLYPAYELEIDPAREAAWAEAFNIGVNAYNENDLEGALEAWTRAATVYGKRPEALQNIAVIYAQQERYADAIRAYREALATLERRPAREIPQSEVEERAQIQRDILLSLGQLLSVEEQYPEAETVYREYLQANPGDVAVQSNLAVALAKQGKQDEALAIYNELLASPNLPPTDVFNIGVGLFQAKEYARAAEAFKRVTEANPRSREALYNYINALYAQDKYAELIEPAERLLTLSPLDEDVLLILAGARRETKQNKQALAVLERIAALPVKVTNLQLSTPEGQTVVRGEVMGNKARAGTPLRLQFTFYGPSGQIGTQTVTVAAPAAEATTPFEVVLQSPVAATGYKYELVN